MKTLSIMLAIKLLVIVPVGQQPDTAERTRAGRNSTVTKGKPTPKQATGKGNVNGGLLYRIPLSI